MLNFQSGTVVVYVENWALSIPPTMKKILLLGLLALVSLASCARKNNCPAYSNTKVEVPDNNK